jgi:hypothetical protein
MAEKEGINISINLNLKNKFSARKINEHMVSIKANPRASQPALAPSSPPGVYQLIDDPRLTDQILDDPRLRTDRKSFSRTAESARSSKKKMQKFEINELKRLQLLSSLKD